MAKRSEHQHLIPLEPILWHVGDDGNLLLYGPGNYHWLKTTPTALINIVLEISGYFYHDELYTIEDYEVLSKKLQNLLASFRPNRDTNENRKGGGQPT